MQPCFSQHLCVYFILQFIASCTHLDAAARIANDWKHDAFAWCCADDELAGQAKKKKAKTAKGRKEYIPNKGDANWVVVLMLLKVANAAMRPQVH